MKRTAAILMTALAASPIAGSASAHPHVFAEANLEVTISGGNVESLRHVWRFDELFSSTVLLEFDANGDLELDDAERKTVSDTVLLSISEFNYFQTVTLDGKEVDLAKPDGMIIDFQDNQMLILFEIKPAKTMPLKGKLAFGVYDPTFYTAIEFLSDENITVAPAATSCKSEIVRPDPDEAIAQNQDTLTEAFFDDPEGNDISKLFATRLELTCGG